MREREAATREILDVISQSRDDEYPVFDKILGSARKLCRVDMCALTLAQEDRESLLIAAFSGKTVSSFEEGVTTFPMDSNQNPSIALRERRTVHTEDLRDTAMYRNGDPMRRAIVDNEGMRTQLAIPMFSGETPIGVFVLFRRRVEAFQRHEIELLEMFAAQAMIAIHNVRQFRELQIRLERERASREILTVISQSRDNEKLVFDTILRLASRLCDAPIAGLILGTVEDSHTSLAAHTGFSPEVLAMFRDDPPTMNPERNFTSRAIFSGEVVHTPDMSDTEIYRSGSRDVKKGVDEGGIRSCIWVPLLSGSRAIGVIALYREVVQPFTDEQIALIETFAAQAVIAIENVSQLKALVEARDAAEAALADLKKAQERLIQSEKMASLGQLTAGIAHEIKNPLNFVNNFAKLSDELLAELGEILEDQIKSLDEEDREDAEDLFQTVRENLGKINQHGQRADSIIKNMLLHSREGPSERQHRTLNPIIEEALNLAYHSARAENSSFNIDMQTDLAADAGEIDCYPQDLMRVFLNLISNGMYAAYKRSLTEDGFAPVISVTSRVNGDRIEVEVRDNGMGIPDDLREKIFTPFFTTKPAGEGTGLGLSLSYDIVVKQHGGDLTVDSAPGQFTVFRTSFPRTLPANTGGEA